MGGSCAGYSPLTLTTHSSLPPFPHTRQHHPSARIRHPPFPSAGASFELLRRLLAQISNPRHRSYGAVWCPLRAASPLTPGCEGSPTTWGETYMYIHGRRDHPPPERRSGALATRRAGQKSSWTADLRITKPDLRITSITQHAADAQVASASGAVPARSSRGPSIPRARARFSSTADAHSTRARTNKTQDTQNTHLTPSEGGVAHTSRITRTQMGARSSSLKVCALHYEPLLVPTRVPPGPLRTSYRFFI